ncbi:hypothetical protein OBBRIDRAFT_93442 [Obba rivulosa]|uniref:Uncharacterized protein n=1 Tax=Obba rivulosa TaxID=1052685 RepID=A0A8E2ATY5_9APHY|nr:hypothetical protein OBBRIDRAFT_93442 [Obba rivulosa]
MRRTTGQEILDEEMGVVYREWCATGRNWTPSSRRGTPSEDASFSLRYSMALSQPRPPPFAAWAISAPPSRHSALELFSETSSQTSATEQPAEQEPAQERCGSSFEAHFRALPCDFASKMKCLRSVPAQTLVFRRFCELRQPDYSSGDLWCMWNAPCTWTWKVTLYSGSKRNTSRTWHLAKKTQCITTSWIGVQFHATISSSCYLCCCTAAYALRSWAIKQKIITVCCDWDLCATSPPSDWTVCYELVTTCDAVYITHQSPLKNLRCLQCESKIAMTSWVLTKRSKHLTTVSIRAYYFRLRRAVSKDCKLCYLQIPPHLFPNLAAVVAEVGFFENSPSIIDVSTAVRAKRIPLSNPLPL